MALRQYRIEQFLGLNQGVCENSLPAGESPDAHNMDTEGGRLSVARGYVRHHEACHGDPAAVLRLFVWHAGGVRRFLTATPTGLQVLSEDGSAFSALCTFAAPAVQVDFQTVKLGSTEHVLMAGGAQPIVKWDGGAGGALPFGSAERLSDVPTALLELYYSRLFAAGDAAHPSRLYWSCAPGDARTVEDWSQSEASENVSGGHVEVGTDSDPITGLYALSNQLLIFKRRSVYRLLGDRPGNYRIYPLGTAVSLPAQGACVRVADVLYFLTADGLCYFDGQTVARMSDADKIRALLAEADLTDCRAAACAGKLYFAVRMGGSGVNNAIIVYDLARRTYMLRDGFTVHGLCADGGVLFLLAGDGHICRFDEGTTYDGGTVAAHWRTPLTDLSAKIAVKQLKELYLRGSGGVITVEATGVGAGVDLSKLLGTQKKQPSGKSAPPAVSGAASGAPPSATEALSAYADTLYRAYRPQKLTYQGLSAEELREQIDAWLRPGYDSAILSRKEQTAGARAELDADAIARGMGSSTYVTDVKSRQLDREARDVARLESEYGAQLGKLTAEASERERERALAVETENSARDHEAYLKAYDAALRLYQSGGLGGGSGGSASGGGGAAKAAQTKRTAKGTASPETCERFIRLLTPTRRREVFTAADPTNTAYREELLASLGHGAYLALMKKYPLA